MPLIRIARWLLILASITATHPTAPAEDTSGDTDALRRSVGRLSVLLPGLGKPTVTEGAVFQIDDGLLVTCLHVVRGASRASVVTNDNQSFPITQVVAVDPYWDLALLRADLPAGTLVPLKLSRSLPEDGSAVSIAVLDHLQDDTDSIDGEPRVLLERRGFTLAPRRFSRGLAIRARLDGHYGDSGSPLFGADGAEVHGVLSMIDTYSYTDQVVSYAIPAERIIALVRASEGRPPVADSMHRWYFDHVMDPVRAMDATISMIHRRPRLGSGGVLDLVVENSHKLSEPLPREARWGYARILRDAATDKEGEEWTQALEGALNAAKKAVAAPAPRIMDELVLADCFYLKGDIHRSLGQRRAAASAFEQAVEHRPDHVDAIRWLAELAIDRGDEVAFRMQRRRLIDVLGLDSDLAAALGAAWEERR